MKLVNFEGLIDSIITTQGKIAALYLFEHLVQSDGFTKENLEYLHLKIQELRNSKGE